MSTSTVKARLAAATPGPWMWGWRTHDDDAPGSVFRWQHATSNADGSMSGIAEAIAMCPRYGRDRFQADAEFIAAARTDLELAVAVIEAAKVLRAQGILVAHRRGCAWGSDTTTDLPCTCGAAEPTKRFDAALDAWEAAP